MTVRLCNILLDAYHSFVVPEPDGCVNLYDWCRNKGADPPILPGNPTLSTDLTCSYLIDNEDAVEGEDYEPVEDDCRNYIRPLNNEKQLMVEFSCAGK